MSFKTNRWNDKLFQGEWYIYIYMYSISFIATENKGESIRERTENRADERVAEIISGKHEEGRSEGRGQEAAWGVLWSLGSHGSAMCALAQFLLANITASN